MGKTKYILLSLGISLFLYFIIINLISISYFNGNNNNTSDITYNGETDIKIDVGNSVNVQIVRNRWYGKIYEEGNSRILYVFDIVRIPIESNNTLYILSHIVFLSFWTLILIITLIFEFISKNEENIYKGGNIE